ncbi:MAG: hypothetical protein ABIR70_14305 [Bryobacteraceae bacterium]
MRALLLGAVGLILTGCNQSAGVPETTAEAKLEPVKVAPPKPVLVPVTLPEGTRLLVRTTSTLSTKTATSGEAFSGSLAEALLVDGKEILPKGAEVTGVVAESDDGGRVKGVASISLRMTGIELAGERVPVKSSLYVKAAPATKKKDAVKIGIGAGIGAAIGAIAGGGKGAAIGAASGGGAGTGVVLATHGDPAVVPAESIISFRLAAPLEVTVP